MGAKTLTVAIATHNRAGSLSRTLASLAWLRLPKNVDWECIVVDNNSTDATAHVVEFFSSVAATTVRRIFEPRTGLSVARNRAVDESRREFILFVDDDVVVEPDWAAEMLEAIERRTLDAVCGLVLPNWEAPPPRWLGPQLYSSLGVHDRARLTADGAEEDLSNFIGASLGFRRSSFERFGRFREDLGDIGKVKLGGEETELLARIIEGGGMVGLAPHAMVHHVIPAQRLTRSFFRRMSFSRGMGSAAACGRTHNHLDKLVKNAWRMALAVAHGDPQAAFHHQLECVNFFGYWRGRLLAQRQQASNDGLAN